MNTASAPETPASLTASTYERLRADVLNGHWAPGSKLGIEALRAHYGTGATPVREALNRLAAEGWVQHLDQRGFAVTSVSEEALRELAKTRVWVETLALTQGLQARTPEWEERLVLALHRLSKTPRSLFDDRYVENPAWEKLHREFHIVLVSQCGSRWLIGFCEQLYDQSHRYRQLAVKKSYKRRHELDEHKAVVESVLAGNAQAACQALAGHYEKTADIILNSAL